MDSGVPHPKALLLTPYPVSYDASEEAALLGTRHYTDIEEHERMKTANKKA